jgi:hypothetical protein
MIELLGIPVSATRRKCALLNAEGRAARVTGEGSWPLRPPERSSVVRLSDGHPDR